VVEPRVGATVGASGTPARVIASDSADSTLAKEVSTVTVNLKSRPMELAGKSVTTSPVTLLRLSNSVEWIETETASSIPVFLCTWY